MLHSCLCFCCITIPLNSLYFCDYFPLHPIISARTGSKHSIMCMLFRVSYVIFFKFVPFILGGAMDIWLQIERLQKSLVPNGANPLLIPISCSPALFFSPKHGFYSLIMWLWIRIRYMVPIQPHHALSVDTGVHNCHLHIWERVWEIMKYLH